MNRWGLSALKKSEKKWRELSRVRKLPEKPTANNCPLCEVYYYDSCEGCPVKLAVNARRCRNTPYNDALDAWGEWRDAVEEIHIAHGESRVSLARAFRRAAKAEADFLLSLIPEDAR